MSITVRRGRPGDEAALHRVAAETFGLACPPGTPQSDVDDFIGRHLSEERFAQYLADPARIVLMATPGSREADAVAYAMLVRGEITDPDVRALVDGASTIELSKFYVRLDSHGRGVAATLMAATIEAAAGTGATTIWLGVNQKNVRAAKFYTKNGFEIIGTKRFLVGEQWHDDHVRLRPLTAPA